MDSSGTRAQRGAMNSNLTGMPKTERPEMPARAEGEPLTPCITPCEPVGSAGRATRKCEHRTVSSVFEAVRLSSSAVRGSGGFRLFGLNREARGRRPS